MLSFILFCGIRATLLLLHFTILHFTISCITLCYIVLVVFVGTNNNYLEVTPRLLVAHFLSPPRILTTFYSLHSFCLSLCVLHISSQAIDRANQADAGCRHSNALDNCYPASDSIGSLYQVSLHRQLVLGSYSLHGFVSCAGQRWAVQI